MATTSNRDKYFWYIEGERIAVVQTKETLASNVNTDPLFESPTATSAGKTLRVHYTAKPSHFTTTLSETSEIPSQFHEALAYKVISELYKLPQSLNLQLAQYFDQQYIMSIREAKKYSKSNHIQGGMITPFNY